MDRSCRNSGKSLLKRASLFVFRQKLVKEAKNERKRLEKRAKTEKMRETWRYLAEVTRELRKSAGQMGKKSKIVKRVPAVGTKTDSENDLPKRVVMRIRDGETGRTKCAAFVEIANTPELRRRGLSKRASLGKMSGMFFDCHGPFWMKDVEFPLDLCYVDESGKVTEKMAMPVDKEGKNLYPRTKTASVSALELPFGFCDRHGVKVGDVLVPSKMVR